MAPQRTSQFTVFGMHFFSGSENALIGRIASWIKRGERRYVCVTSLHGFVESQKNPQLLKIHNASGATVTDGMPLVWIGKLRGLRQTRRIFGPQLMTRLCRESEKRRWRIFLYGTNETTLGSVRQHLLSRFPGLRVVGTYGPPYRTVTVREERRIRTLINQAKPDIIFVGLSTPKQERWMSRNLPHLDPCVAIGVGAAFDYLAGNIRQAPEWVAGMGFEWLFRLIQQPHLLRRYIANHAYFTFLLSKAFYRWLVKIGYGIFILLLCLAVAPLALCIAISILLTSGTPILYRQKRVGHQGKIFTLLKFRTMRKNSDRMQKRLKNLNEVDGPVFKIRNDPRFTAVGKFLSHTGLDELPQLLNILLGDMAIIGPRPLPVGEVAKLTPRERAREKIKPGIISPWILEGYHRQPFSAWMKSDQEYVKRKRFAYDVGLFFRTFGFFARLVMKEFRNRT